MHIVYAVIIHFGDLVMMKNEDKFEKYCKYCEKAKTLSDPDRMLCPNRGVVDAGYVCRLFRYDPLKRAPKIRKTMSVEKTMPIEVFIDL